MWGNMKCNCTISASCTYCCSSYGPACVRCGARRIRASDTPLFLCTSCYNAELILMHSSAKGSLQKQLALDLDVDLVLQEMRNPTTFSKTCNCDFITVILPYGCKCGGI